MYAAIIADTIMSVTLVPVWYEGEGGEWLYSTKKIIEQIKHEWEFK
jgi:hypothetical protein